MPTVGIHVIWTSYGTWLPGDDRGHWSPLFDFYGNLIELGGRLNRSDLATRTRALNLMKEAAKILSDEEVAVVAETLGSMVSRPETTSVMPDLSVVYAAAIEKTHVHLLLAPVNEDIGTVVGRLKGKTSSNVLALPSNRGRTRTWTAKYWKVFLFDTDALAAVRDYIENHNVRRGLPPSPFPWISPIT
jgi:REP element-mobilizing transposase RayT